MNVWTVTQHLQLGTSYFMCLNFTSLEWDSKVIIDLELHSLKYSLNFADLKQDFELVTDLEDDLELVKR